MMGKLAELLAKALAVVAKNPGKATAVAVAAGAAVGATLERKRAKPRTGK